VTGTSGHPGEQGQLSLPKKALLPAWGFNPARANSTLDPPKTPHDFRPVMRTVSNTLDGVSDGAIFRNGIWVVTRETFKPPHEHHDHPFHSGQMGQIFRVPPERTKSFLYRERSPWPAPCFHGPLRALFHASQGVLFRIDP